MCWMGEGNQFYLISSIRAEYLVLFLECHLFVGVYQNVKGFKFGFKRRFTLARFNCGRDKIPVTR